MSTLSMRLTDRWQIGIPPGVISRRGAAPQQFRWPCGSPLPQVTAASPPASRLRPQQSQLCRQIAICQPQINDKHDLNYDRFVLCAQKCPYQQSDSRQCTWRIARPVLRCNQVEVAQIAANISWDLEEALGSKQPRP